MGVDLALKAKAAFKKALDRHLADLAAGNLFSRGMPSGVTRSAAADVTRDTRLTVGEELVVQCVNGRIVALRGIDEVACFTDPDPGWADGLRAGSAAIPGLVEVVHDLGGGFGVAEVRLVAP